MKVSLTCCSLRRGLFREFFKETREVGAGTSRLGGHPESFARIGVSADRSF